MKLAPQDASRNWLRLRKWLASFTKRSWSLDDYPIILVEQLTFVSSLPERCRVKRWRIDIAGWLAMSGLGDTLAEAEEDLRRNFESRISSGDKLPRPGGKNPVIQYAATDELDRNSDILQPFISDVLQLPWAWISNDSSLWDFHTEMDNAAYYQRIQTIYGIDVSDIEGARIHDILDRIAESK